MVEPEQFAFDWRKAEVERPFMEQWDRNVAADRHNWTPEAMARSWSGFHDRQSWDALPKYERNLIVTLYLIEQQHLEFRQRQWDDKPQGQRHFRIRQFEEVYRQPSREALEAHWGRARRMAEKLAADWSAQRPPSEFTYDPCVAATVSMFLGRKVEAIKPTSPFECL
jgi:hypothetical protein